MTDRRSQSKDVEDKNDLQIVSKVPRKINVDFISEIHIPGYGLSDVVWSGRRDRPPTRKLLVQAVS